MENLTKYIIKNNASLRQALNALNNLSNDILTLFVVNDKEEMIGTLTDGDIRRKLVGGSTLDEFVSEAMNRNFYYIKSGNIEVSTIRKIKELGITLVPLLNEHGKIDKIYNLKKNKSLLPIDAVLMAGGKGERLRPLTENTPKPLLQVGDKPIIDYNVDRLMTFGIENISVTVNYLKEQIEAYFSEQRNNIKIRCVREPQYLGTIGSVKFVKSFNNDVILIMNSDLFTNIDYEDFYLHFIDSDADMSVAAVPYSVNIPYGIFELSGRDIIGIKEKPTFNYYANAGIYLIKRKLLELIPDGEFYNATDFIALLIEKGFKVIRFPLTGYWIDIGQHEDLRKARELVKHL